jgi:hypothetical protein
LLRLGGIKKFSRLAYQNRDLTGTSEISLRQNKGRRYA